jgi:hypothetical protein
MPKSDIAIQMDQLRATLPFKVGLNFAEVAEQLKCSASHAIRTASTRGWVVYQFDPNQSRKVGYLVNQKTIKYYANKA